MNTTIRNRDELLLAKIAGENVDIANMTPNTAANLKEKLMLDIAKRVDNIAKATKTATTETAGTMKAAANVAYAAGEAPTAAEFKALIDALIEAGIMAAPASNG